MKRESLYGSAAMADHAVSGTEGYAAQAQMLASRWDAVAFAELHAPILPLLPPPPARVLDIGAGSGRGAAAFARMGYQVVAVEPVAELRSRAAERHTSPRIAWVDDSLPHLKALAEPPHNDGPHFDVVMLTAVWMHLDATERAQAMRRITSLIAPGRLMSMSLRHGPPPEGRRIFDVSAGETIALATAQDLHVCLQSSTGSLQRANRAAGITWTRLAFKKA